jgi:copper chaperone CopZ
MSQSPKSASSLPILRRNIHFQIQLLIFPAIVLALLAILIMKGCAAAPGSGEVASSKCSHEQRMNCLCETPGVISFAVEGMSCPNCAKELQEVIAAVPGVKAAKVCFEDKKAFVTLDKDHPATIEAIEAAVAKRQEEHLKLENDPDCLKPKG